MAGKETAILKQVMLRLSALGAKTFRNNQGVAKYPDGAIVKYGVANPGGSDLIGWLSVPITEDMVGRKVAVFLACEVKAPDGRTTAEQINFVAQVKAAGGIGMIVRSEDEACVALVGEVGVK